MSFTGFSGNSLTELVFCSAISQIKKQARQGQQEGVDGDQTAENIRNNLYLHACYNFMHGKNATGDLSSFLFLSQLAF